MSLIFLRLNLYAKHLALSKKLQLNIKNNVYRYNNKVRLYSSNVEPTEKVNDTNSVPPDKVQNEQNFDEGSVLSRLKLFFKNEKELHGLVPIFKKALIHGNKVAIRDQQGVYTYARIYNAAKKLGIQVANFCGSGSSARVAFLCPNDVTYTLAQWSCWFSGQIAVPLSGLHPAEMLEYFIKDSQSNLVITTPEFEKKIKPITDKLNCILIVIDHSFIPDELDPENSYLDPKNENVIELNSQLIVEGALSGQFYSNANAMILYTSGTTARPKGVVFTHKNIESQVTSIGTAWSITHNDSLLHVLPLNHVHGCINALLCPLYYGAKCVMLPHFDSHRVWSTLLNVNMPTKDRVNLFMAVPTIYSLLIEEYTKMFGKDIKMVEYIKAHCETKIRLMISGSAPLPTSTFNKWYEITGHKLLERYGMTEIGMALSNPLLEDPSRERKPGYVGCPLPNVSVKIVNGLDTIVEMAGINDSGFWSKPDAPVYSLKVSKIESGDLYVKGPSVFKGYWNNDEATKEEFDGDWFKTGDTAIYENNTFKILGRTSIDIIKTGGYKVSALEIETQFMEHPLIADVAVMGLPDITWGQRVAAVIVLRNENNEFSLNELKDWSKDKIASYAQPTVVKIVTELPKNQMGKVNKKLIISEYFSNVNIPLDVKDDEIKEN